MKSSSANQENAPPKWWDLSRKIWVALAVFLLLVLVISLSVYFGTRPETVQVIETTAEETLPSLIKVAPIGTTGGAILIEYTELLRDNSTVFYYLTTQDFNLTTLESITESDDVGLYLTRSSNPTIEDLPIQAQNFGRALSMNETVLRVGLLKDLAFPLRLPDFFLPGNFNGVILVEEDGMEGSVGLVEVTRASFSVIVDPERNIATFSVSQSPTVAPTTKIPSTSPTQIITPSPSSLPSQTPTESPTLSPTVSPTVSPTISPTRSPSGLPSLSPTPAATFAPSLTPTLQPTASTTDGPSVTPTTSSNPTQSSEPSSTPTISTQPSLRGATATPSQNPTELPSQGPSKIPTTMPTTFPSMSPSTTPSGKLANLPSANPTEIPTIPPTRSPTRSPTRPPTRSPTRPPTRSPTLSPTKFPTAEPTQSPTTAPAPDPGSSSLPPILTAELSGSYRIDGTITIDYVQGFENGQVVNRPRLQFDIPNLSNAPGPYLYLSKRPFSETEGEDLEDDDILIPIDSGEDGQFNVRGRFDQVLDEIENVQDLEDYTNGSWIVWCGPFGVWIGGGEISAI